MLLKLFRESIHLYNFVSFPIYGVNYVKLLLVKSKKDKFLNSLIHFGNYFNLLNPNYKRASFINFFKF
jgi:hypothetical protein